MLRASGFRAIHGTRLNPRWNSSFSGARTVRWWSYLPCSSRDSLRDGLAFTAVCDIDLDAFTPEVIEALERDGFACIRGPDWQALAAAGDFAMEDGNG